jgi:hypothetical protein
MSFVTRKGAGVGEGEGAGVKLVDGVGVGDGVCARADAMFRCGVASATAPIAGTSFTNVRRSRSSVIDPADFRACFSFNSDFFIVVSLMRAFDPGQRETRSCDSNSFSTAFLIFHVLEVAA